MAERRNCNFCGNSIEPGTGRMYVRVDGTVFYFDSHKCYENFVSLGRVPQDTKWSSLSRNASRWKGRAPKQKAPGARVYAPKRTPSRVKEEEAPEETGEQKTNEEPAPVDKGEETDK